MISLTNDYYEVSLLFGAHDHGYGIASVFVRVFAYLLCMDAFQRDARLHCDKFESRRRFANRSATF